MLNSSRIPRNEVSDSGTTCLSASQLAIKFAILRASCQIRKNGSKKMPIGNSGTAITSPEGLNSRFLSASLAFLELLLLACSCSACHICQQERTRETQRLWDEVNRKSAKVGKGANALDEIRTEAKAVFDCLSFDAFPRFLESDGFKAIAAGKGKKKGGKGAADKPDVEAAAEAESVLEKAGVQLPKDADEWLNNFTTIAETIPASIVISDMTISGAPMVYVNDEFCKVTGYERTEAQGRNCRFLQGPETEAEAIKVIRSTLSKGEDCHVKLTNYRKSGEKFQNLLTMRPVFDADNVYRYVIGVQFEVVLDEDLKARMLLLDKLLKLLPRRRARRASSRRRCASSAARSPSSCCPAASAARS